LPGAGLAVSNRGMEMRGTPQIVQDPRVMETDITGLLQRWKQMLWGSQGDIKEIQK